jgi:hypothetical protein
MPSLKCATFKILGPWKGVVMRKFAVTLGAFIVLGTGYAMAEEATPALKPEKAEKAVAGSNDATKCWPSRNVAIAETAEHYRASCEQGATEDKAPVQP